MLTKFVGIAGHRGWRWILWLEGMPTVLLAIAFWVFMADQPSTARYLNAEERDLLLARLTRQTGMTKSAQQLHRKDVRKGLLDWKVWTFCFAQFGVDTMLYGFSTFLPTIIKGIMPHATSAIVQVLTIPVYSLGAITYLIVGIISDRQQRRGIYCVLFGTVSLCGYIMLISNGGSAVHYAGCFLVACGMYCVIGLPLAWLPSHTPRYGKRTTTIALQAAIGNSAGIMSSFVSLVAHSFVISDFQLMSQENFVGNMLTSGAALSFYRSSTLCQRTCCHHCHGSFWDAQLWIHVGVLRVGQ